MVVADRRAALIFRVAAALVIALGITRLLGIGDPPLSVSALLFYTMQSNILCLVWMVALIIGTITDLRGDGPRGWSTPSPRFGGAVMQAITVTMLIYLVVLLPQSEPGYVPFTLTDTLVHVVAPVLLILDWALFSPKGRFRGWDPVLWAAIPYAYLLFAFGFGALGGEFSPGESFPYPFMDITDLGLSGVALWIGALTTALILVGYLFVLIDRVLGQVGMPRGGRAD
jgi:hypothetical protein